MDCRGEAVGFGEPRGYFECVLAANGDWPDVGSTLAPPPGSGLRQPAQLHRPVLRRSLAGSIGSMSVQGFLKRTMRLVLVPLRLLSTPQQAAVFVNACELISTRTGASP